MLENPSAALSTCTLDGQAEGFESGHEFAYGALCWIEILYSDELNARISIDGKVWEIEDISIEDLVGIVKDVENLIPEETVKQGT